MKHLPESVQLLLKRASGYPVQRALWVGPQQEILMKDVSWRILHGGNASWAIGQFDAVVVQNPKAIGDSFSYLRPGGMLVLLCPETILSDPKLVKFRKGILKRAILSGCVGLPGVTLIFLHVFQKRVSGLSPSERDFCSGAYRNTVPGRKNIVGVLSDSGEVQGSLSLEILRRRLEGFHFEKRDSIEWSLSKKYRRTYKPKIKGKGRIKIQKSWADYPLESTLRGPAQRSLSSIGEAACFSYRVARYHDLLRGGQQEATRASFGQEELVRDLKAFAKRSGHPHKMKGPQLKALHSAISRRGKLLPTLRLPIDEGIPKDPAGRLRYLFARTGTPQPASVLGATEEELSQDNSLCRVPNGWMPMENWLVGRFSKRFSQLKRLKGVPTYKVRYQQRVLRNLKTPVSLLDIPLTPRNSLLALPNLIGALSDYVTHLCTGKGPELGIRIYCRREVYREEIHGEVSEAQQQIISKFVGYLNRQIRVESVGGKKVSRFNSSKADYFQRMEEEALLEEEFLEWALRSDVWRNKIEKEYNRRYLDRIPAPKDPRPIPLCRLNEAFSPHGHQNQALRWLDVEGSGILAFTMGAGKTASALLHIAHQRQKGLSKRPLVVVPNSVVQKWYEESRFILPDYRIGVIGMTWVEGKFRPDTGRRDERKEKWLRFAKGEFDLLICAESVFVRDLKLSEKRTREILKKTPPVMREDSLERQEKQILHRRLKALQFNLKAAFSEFSLSYGADGGPDDDPLEWSEEKAQLHLPGQRFKRWKTLTRRITKLRKQIGRAKESLSKPQKSMLYRSRKENLFTIGNTEPLVNWEGIGVDLLVMDEAHRYKNLFSPASRYGEQKIAYMGAQDRGNITVQAWDLYLKAQHILRENSNRGVVLLTATPVKNSPIELYNLLSIVSTKLSDWYRLRGPDEFVDRHCRIDSAPIALTNGEMSEEISVVGLTHREALQPILSRYIFYLSRQQLLDQGLLDASRLPKVHEHSMEIDMDPFQQETYQKLREAIREMRDPKAQLVQLDLLSKAATDLNLLVETEAKARSELLSKPNLKRIETLHKKLSLLEAVGLSDVPKGFLPPKFIQTAQQIRKSRHLGHLIFCDYNSCHKRLATIIHRVAGVPRERIAFLVGSVSKSDRQKIAHGFNGTLKGPDGKALPPKYDIIIGNSPTMAEGMDLQVRTCGIHHVTYPWEPATMRQRNGRGDRQGNTTPRVHIFYHMTKGSFDILRVDALLGKLTWQEALFGEGNAEGRSSLLAMEETQAEMIARIYASNEEEAKEMILEHQKRVAERSHLRHLLHLRRQYRRFVAASASKDLILEDLDQMEARLEGSFKALDLPIEAVKKARQVPTHLDFLSGVYVYQGQYLEDLESQQKYLIQEVDPVAGRVLARKKGSLEILYITKLSALLTSAPKTVPQWDDRAECLRTLPSIRILRDNPLVRISFSDLLSEQIRRGDGTPICGQEVLPLYHPEKGLMLLLQGIPPLTLSSETEGYELLSPHGRESWVTFLRGARSEYVRILRKPAQITEEHAIIDEEIDSWCKKVALSWFLYKSQDARLLSLGLALSQRTWKWRKSHGQERQRASRIRGTNERGGEAHRVNSERSSHRRNGIGLQSNEAGPSEGAR